ncbi:MAG: hypothetical protein H6623_06950 [Bdellovibrionaceae bacterium]|nr:hypothetical protein [Pseudobdellovibrionaceae bacterium]
MIPIRYLNLLAAGALALTGAACSSGGGGSTAASTYTLSGTLDPGQSSSSFEGMTPASKAVDLSFLGIHTLSRTQCSDGYYYSVYCVSFSTPPVAAEGNVDCTNGGAFSVSGLPLSEPIGCFVRRYDSDSSTTGTNVGAIEIPANNLNGSTDTIVSSGNVSLSVSIDSSGTITAQVQSGGSNIDTGGDTSTDSAFTASNMNGVWSLTCDSQNGGTNFTPGLCKCFLGEDAYSSHYSNKEQCLNDPNGAGAALTGTIGMGIGLYIHEATANTTIPLDNNGSIASGSTIKAISIWGTSGTPGNYVSLKTGGEGVTNLGGAITWSTSPADPTTAIAWTSGSVTINDHQSHSVTFTVPALSNANTKTHSQWMSWIASLVTAAEGGGFACSRGPSDAYAHYTQTGTGLASNIECANEVLEALRDGSPYTLPRMYIHPFCNNNGCLISTDANDNANPYYSANAFNAAHLEFENWKLNYSTSAWASTDNNSSVAPASGLDAGIGVGPGSRFVFEPLITNAKGAGFKQRSENEQHYECGSGTPQNDWQVQDANCNVQSGEFYELVCHVAEELAIKFIGTSSPMDVVFNQLQTPVSARLIKHTGSGTTEVTPATSGGVIALCKAKAGSGGGTFMAKATKQ